MQLVSLNIYYICIRPLNIFYQNNISKQMISIQYLQLIHRCSIVIDWLSKTNWIVWVQDLIILPSHYYSSVTRNSTNNQIRLRIILVFLSANTNQFQSNIDLDITLTPLFIKLIFCRTRILWGSTSFLWHLDI